MGPEFKGTKCSYFVDLFVMPLLYVVFYLLQMVVDFDSLAAGFGQQAVFLSSTLSLFDECMLNISFCIFCEWVLHNRKLLRDRCETNNSPATHEKSLDVI